MLRVTQSIQETVRGLEVQSEDSFFHHILSVFDQVNQSSLLPKLTKALSEVVSQFSIQVVSPLFSLGWRVYCARVFERTG